MLVCTMYICQVYRKKILKNGSHNEWGLLVKGISETIKNEAKEQKDGLLPMLLGTLADIILENALLGNGVIRADEGPIRAEQNF